MKDLLDTQLAYLAGFLDADGSIIAQLVSRSDYTLKWQIKVSVIIVLKASRSWLLEKFCHEVGMGNVRDRGDGIFEFSIVTFEEVELFLTQIKPFLTLKQKQSELVLTICKEMQPRCSDARKFLELCKMTDLVSSLNDSKNRTNTAEKVEKTLRDFNLI